MFGSESVIKSQTQIHALRSVAACAFVLGLFPLLIIFLLFWNNHSVSDLGNLGEFSAGTTGLLWALAVGLYVIATFETQQKQQFETTFFELIRLHHEIVGALFLERVDGTKEFHGRRCFQVMYKKFDDDNWMLKPALDDREVAAASYENLFDQYDSSLGHYFRNLYHIFTFVRSHNLSDEARYIKIIGAQLSTYELLLLFYNGISQYGEKFREGIEATGFLEQLKHDELVCDPPEVQLTFYRRSAYGNKELPEWLVFANN